jgi:hypothetical protein
VQAVDTAAKNYLCPAATISISAQNKLEASRILAPNQNNNFRIGGELNSKISISFVACNHSGANGNWNFASGVLQNLTGENYISTMLIGDNSFQTCFLDSVAVQIDAFAPVTITADFTCLNPPINSSFVGATINWSDDLNSGIAYGFNTVITNGTTLSDANRESISYKINCDRTYSTSIGETSPNNIFLNGVEKELSIKSHNIGAYIDYTGYGEMIVVDPKNAAGQSIVGGGFGMSSNCKITAQNLSVQEGDVLMGDISLREIIL